MPRKATSNVAGLERTIRAVQGRLVDADEALIALARGLAAAVDLEPGNAALWREYRAAVAALAEAAATGDVDDDTKDFLLTIRTPVRATMVDPSES